MKPSVTVSCVKVFICVSQLMSRVYLNISLILSSFIRSFRLETSPVLRKLWLWCRHVGSQPVGLRGESWVWSRNGGRRSSVHKPRVRRRRRSLVLWRLRGNRRPAAGGTQHPRTAGKCPLSRRRRNRRAELSPERRPVLSVTSPGGLREVQPAARHPARGVGIREAAPPGPARCLSPVPLPGHLTPSAGRGAAADKSLIPRHGRSVPPPTPGGCSERRGGAEPVDSPRMDH